MTVFLLILVQPIGAEWVVTGNRADAGKAESAATLLGGPAGEACEHCGHEE